MPELNQIFKCSVCGNIVEIVGPGKGQLVCCDQPMEPQKANDQDASLEKHVPVVEVIDKGIKVSVGSILHPMEEQHYIEWIEVVAEGRTERKFLSPEDQPVADFCADGGTIQVRAYCNLHGLWKDSVD